MYLPNRPAATATDHGTLLIAAEKTVNNFVFAVIPLFVLMGFLVAAAGNPRAGMTIKLACQIGGRSPEDESWSYP